MSDPGRPTWQSRAAEVVAWGAAVLAWVVCLSSEVELAWRHSFQNLLGILWALGLDLTALSCMFLALDAAKRGRRTREVWAIAGAATVAMVTANVLVSEGDVVGAFMHALAPILAVALWHALVHGRRPVEARSAPNAATSINTDLEARPEGASHVALPDVGTSSLIYPRAARPTRARSGSKARAILARLSERADVLGSDEARSTLIREVAQETRTSRAYVRKLAARVRSDLDRDEVAA